MNAHVPIASPTPKVAPSSKSDLVDLNMTATQIVGKNEEASDLVGNVDESEDLISEEEIAVNLPDTDEVELDLLGDVPIGVRVSCETSLRWFSPGFLSRKLASSWVIPS